MLLAGSPAGSRISYLASCLLSCLLPCFALRPFVDPRLFQLPFTSTSPWARLTPSYSPSLMPPARATLQASAAPHRAPRPSGSPPIRPRKVQNQQVETAPCTLTGAESRVLFLRQRPGRCPGLGQHRKPPGSTAQDRE
ncbi:hypothetical protein BKA56DRAFT_566595 [Ilyonectria sp. MPI-CAGE-AT-0026]|nr:hypothetical protein BKA56DRAFT_566595 [Ilyonectria sp. MPI-CAGE-AT-0026]